MDDIKLTESFSESHDEYVLVVASSASPAQAIEEFTSPTFVREWWGGLLSLTGDPGGTYRVEFPQVSAVLDGNLTRWTTTQLAFVWSWETNPNSALTRVEISAERSQEGVAVRIVHGGYPAGSESERESHRDGWRWHLPRLANHLRQRLP